MVSVPSVANAVLLEVLNDRAPACRQTGARSSSAPPHRFLEKARDEQEQYREPRCEADQGRLPVKLGAFLPGHFGTLLRWRGREIFLKKGIDTNCVTVIIQ